jgi:phosphohistidine phosphatase SixA
LRQPAAATCLLAVLAVALTGCGGDGEAPGTQARPLDEVVAALQRGGHVVFLRHTATDHSVEDRPPVLAGCHRQRPLTDEGREDARVIGHSFRALGIRVGEVLSSAYCRTRETAELAFGRAETVTALTGLVLSPAQLERRLARVRRLLATPPPRGRNTVLVGHVVTVEELVGIEIEEGEIAVFEPLGGTRFRLLGRIPVFAWPQLVEQASDAAALALR